MYSLLRTARLVGSGRFTEGLVYELQPGRSAVIGRHSECCIPLQAPERSPDLELISRQHAVVGVDDEHGWHVYDTGSTNGTAVLLGGLAPPVRIAPGIRHGLRPDDVIELAGCEAFRFTFEELDAAAQLE